MNRTKTNTWRKIQGKKPVRSMEDVVKRLQGYVKTYSNQPGYEDYADEMFINDMLYGIGIALDAKYEFGNGHTLFKELLKEHLDDKIS